MNMESFTASLHAGLIQRARPPKVVPLREDGFAGRAPVVQLRASDIARARPAPTPLVRADHPRVVPARAETAPTVERAEARPAGATPSRRFGLTVRVDESLRERLLGARLRTGRTTQSILQDALAGYLAALERKQTGR